MIRSLTNRKFLKLPGGKKMGKTVQFSPSDYVDRLMNLNVPGYTGYPTGLVSLSNYLSANPNFGGASKAGELLTAIRQVVRGKPEADTTRSLNFARVFTGQGLPADTIDAMGIVNTYSDQFKDMKSMKDFSKKDDFLQAMVDGKCFGVDCIGFVGTYLAEAGLTTGYQGGRPLDYAGRFSLVRSLNDVDDLCVVMRADGQHIQIIDKVVSRDVHKISVNLCQSSSGGPQTNQGVTLSDGVGAYLPIEDFRAAMTQGSASWTAKQAEYNEKKGANEGYETFLRRTMTQKDKGFGYLNGAIFQLHVNGTPVNPVGGSVYVGKLTGLGLASAA